MKLRLGEIFSLPTNRDIYQYQKLLGFGLNTLKGKVLDIGSGNQEIFAKQAAEIGIDVVSMNPKLKKERIRKIAQREEGHSVAGRAQSIPFTDNAFDYEVALFSVPMYVACNYVEYRKFFSEIIRTLKLGGKCYMFPIDKLDISVINDVAYSLKYKAKFTFESVQGEKGLRLILEKT